MNGLMPDENDRYEQIIGQRKELRDLESEQSAVADEEQQYQQIIRSKVDQRDEVLRQSLMVSVSKNPDQMAKIQKISEQSGMPRELVERNIAKLLNQERVESLKESARYSPILARQLSDPDFAMLAYDDYDSLSGLEYVVTKGRDYAGSLAKGVVGQGVGSTLSGFGELYGVGVRQLEGALDQVLPNSAMSFLRTPIPWYADPQQILKRPGQTLKDLGETMGAPVQRQGLDTDVIEGIGQLGYQIAAWLTAGPAASAILFAQGADVMADKTREDTATQAQKDAAIITGAGITALTERYGLGQILNRLPPQIRNRTLRFIADKATAGGIEASQEIVEGLLHDITRRVFTNENAPILEGALREASAAALSAAIVRAALGVRGFRNARQQEEFIQALGDNAKASKLRERMPERFQQLVDQLTQAGPVKEVYVPADQFQRYYQSQNIDPAAKAAEFGASNYDEAVIAGTDIIIPMDQFTTKLAPTDDLQGLFQDIRLEQGGLTGREYAEFQQEQEARLQEILDDARRSVGEIQTPELLAIRDEMREQLVATGYETNTADAYAIAYAKVISNLAERAGLNAKSLHDRYSLSVTRPLPDVLTRDRRSDSQIDPLLDRLRKGDFPKEQEIYGKSLVDFLIEQGGLRPYGELVDVDIGRGPFQRNLVQEMGMDADTAAQLAVEYGYLQGRGYEDVTERDLFDAIEEELAGTRQYSVQQTNEQLLALQTQLEELSRVLEQIGVDITQITDNAEVRRLLEQATQAPEIRDAIEPLFQAARRIDENTGLPLNADGTVTVYHHTSREAAVLIRRTKQLRAAAEPDVYVTTENRPITGYGEEAVPINVDPSRLVLDDEFPDGRKDFRLNVGAPGGSIEVTVVPIDSVDADTAARLDALDQDAFDELMIEEGIQPANQMDVNAFWDRGYAIYGIPEMDEQPFRIASKEVLDNYAPDLLIALSPETLSTLPEALPQQFPAEQTVEFDGFVTGQPVTFDFVHNTESATAMFGLPEPGDRFQRDLEPSGRYMTRVADAARVDTSGTLIAGTITFNNPLVVDSTNWKQELSDFYGATGRELSQKLIAAGYDGVVTINPATDTRPAFTSEILDLTTFEPERALYQEERGFIQFGPERKFNITLLERADLSTFLHETGHFYLEVLGDLAQGPEASPQLQDDYAIVLNFLGLKSREELTLDGKDPSSAAYKKAVAAHEKFARAHEAYLMEGKAPSEELRSIFQRFGQWLKMIYKDFLRLDVKLTNEVRGVFDRMYASDQEIEAAKAEGSFDQLFATAADAGMTEAEFEVYKESVRQATESAKDALTVKLMKEMQREREAWWKEQLANVKEEVAKEFDELPVYRAFKELTDGEIKLNKAELVGLYGAEYLKRLPRGFQRVYTTKEGMPLEAAAREFGFPSGDSLVEALIGMPNRREYINAEAERIMLERHGDMMTDGTIADEAMLELHNSQREKVLATELRALRRKQREVRPFVQAERQRQASERAEMRAALDVPPTSAFREAARGMIGQTAVRDLNPQRFLNAQRKHGKAAERAIVAGDTQLAADSKQKELLNHFLYLEARKAKERSDSIAEYIRKFEKKSTRERIGKAGQIYLEQIDAILDGYEFRRIPNRRIDRRAVLNAFVQKMQNAGQNDETFSEEPVNIPQSVLEDGRQINYRQLSYDQLQAVNEAVKNIDNLARLKNKLLRAAEKRELDEVARDAIESLQANSKGGQAKKLESALPAERPGRFLKGFMLLHTKFSTMMRQMDGWKDDGIMWNLFVRPLNQAADYEAVKRAEATQRLADIFRVYRETSLFTKKHIKTLGQSMTLQGRLMVALNWGRAENRQRLMDGNGFTQPQIDEILGSLDQRDWDVVQNIWKLLDSYWPDIESQYQRLYGVAPQKSETIPLNTKFGTIEGGYFPIKYDPTKTAQAQAQSADEILQQMKSGAYMRSQTKNGFTKEVLEKLDRPIKLDFSSLYEHLGEVVHDLALREYLLDTNKLMNHRVDNTTLKQSIIDNYGDQMYREIVDTLRDVSIGDIGARNAFEQAMSHLRAGVSIAGMGWNLMTGLMQPLGITQSFVRIGPKWVSKGLMKWGMDAVSLQNSGKFIYEKSDFMRTRNLTQNREIAEIRNQIKRQGRFPMARQAWGVIEDSYFQLIIQGQKLVDFPTWLGAYEKALSEGKDDAKAVALADQAVMDSQGGGSVKDLAAIQRGGPLLKLWTNFYSYFNTTFNLTKEVFGRTNFRDPISIGRLAVDVVMLYSAPVILGEALREAAGAFVGGGEDDEEFITKLERAHISYLLGTVVGLREFSTAFDPRFGYSGPAGVRFIADFNRFVTQVSQGELDEALRRSTVATVGTLLHYPAGQINRIIDGIEALQDGRTENPAALIFGVPR